MYSKIAKTCSGILRRLKTRFRGAVPLKEIFYLSQKSIFGKNPRALNKKPSVHLRVPSWIHQPFVHLRVPSWIHQPFVHLRVPSWIHQPSVHLRVPSWIHQPSVHLRVPSWIHQPFVPLHTLSWILLLSACTSAPIPATTETPAPSATPLLLTATALPATETPIPAEPTAIPPERAKYTLYATLDYANKSVEVRESILYPNLSENPLNDLLLAVEPNLWADGFSLREISLDGNPVNYNLEGQRLSLALPAPLEPNATLQLDLHYTLRLPFAAQADPNVSRPRIYGYTERQINLTNWYPFIVPRLNGEWILHEPWYYGEHLVYEAADYEINLQVNDPNVVVAASANAEPNAEWTRYKLQAGRTFVFSFSPEFLVKTEKVEGVTVYSYYFPLYETGGKKVLDTSAEALRIYSKTYGAYPHASLAAVMGDFNDGMEYSAFYFLPRDFYNLYDGTQKNYLTFVAAHETSHQWWFETVANDQALEPWLDESLCTYSERIFYENIRPDLLNWWWQYRMYYYNPEAKTDIPLYEGGGFHPYTNAAYFRGAHFLEELRQRIGDEAFFAFLQDYLSQNAGKIATGDDFFRILRAHTDADFSDLTQKYFRTPR